MNAPNSLSPTPSFFNHHQQQHEANNFFTVLYNQYTRLMLNFTDSYLPFVAALARNLTLSPPSPSHPPSTPCLTPSHAHIPQAPSPPPPFHSPLPFRYVASGNFKIRCFTRSPLLTDGL
ncbi:hypothetical protein GE21DRAFT_1278688 [Neurospora crassa]|nr:hypothetical protein GE21DRAFT_1278688 [Neurospora crassa]